MPLGDTDIIKTVREVIAGSRALTHRVADAADFASFLADRVAAINVGNNEGNTPLHLACGAAPSDQYACRSELVSLLLKCGANIFLLNNRGQTPIDVVVDWAPADSVDFEREALVKLVYDHRVAEEKRVPSMAPLSASRLMKRAKEDKGNGVFSVVIPHCLYYLYKGAVYLWDTITDVEHVIYQPRDQVARIGNVEAKLQSFYKRKSFVAHGGDDPQFDINDEETLLGDLKTLESQVPLVHHFTTTGGLRASNDIVPPEGVVEWVLCNTGALIAVHFDRFGIKLREGGAAGGSLRRKSHVCGASATYPEGKQPHIRVLQNCSVRFTRRPNANKVCCAVDGLHGVVGYIAATKQAAAQVAGSQLGTSHGSSGHLRVCGGGGGSNLQSPFAASGVMLTTSAPFSEVSTPATSTKHNAHHASGSAHRVVHFLSDAAQTLAVSVDLSESASAGGGSSSESPAFAVTSTSTSSTSGNNNNNKGVSFFSDTATTGEASAASAAKVPIFAAVGEIAFRVVCFRSMVPKVGFDDCMVDLCNKWEPFANMTVTEFVLKKPRVLPQEGTAAAAVAAATKQPEEDIEPVCVQMCGPRLFLVFLTTGVIAIDASVTPPVRIDVPTRPEGPVIDGVGMHIQRLRSIRSAAPQLHFAQVSRVVELFQVHYNTRNPEEPKEFVPVLRIAPDRVSPHRYTPVFHPTEDAMVLLYQSNRRQELCTYHFSTRRMQSVCRLPKPSSLRFYETLNNTATLGSNSNSVQQQQQRDQQNLNNQELPELSFAFSVDGAKLLRYNVSMHVMSIYAWEDVYELLSKSAAAVSTRYINTTFTREPLKVDKINSRSAAALAAASGSPKAAHVAVKGDDCVWMIVECAALKRLQAEAWAEYDAACRRSSGTASNAHSPFGGAGTFCNDFGDEETRATAVALGLVVDIPEQRRDKIIAMHKVAREIHATVGASLRKVVMAHGGRLTQYTAPASGGGADETGEGATGEEEGVAFNFFESSDARDAAALSDDAQLRADCPELPSIWFATFSVPLEAVRAAIKITRDLVATHWSAALLAIPAFSPIKLEYRPKSTLEKRFKEAAAVEDPDAVAHLRRGPMTTIFLGAGHTRSNPELLRATILEALENGQQGQGQGQQSPRDGVVVVDGNLMKSLRPLLQFFAASPVAAVSNGRVTTLVPQELEKRIMAPTNAGNNSSLPEPSSSQPPAAAAAAINGSGARTASSHTLIAHV